MWTRYACKHGEAHGDGERVSIAEHLALPAIETEAALYRDPDERSDNDPLARREALAELRACVVEMRADGLIDRAEVQARAAEIDAELAKMDAPKPSGGRHRLVGAKSAGTPRAVARPRRDDSTSSLRGDAAPLSSAREA